MNNPPKDSYPEAEKEIFQNNLKILQSYGIHEQAVQFWDDYKQYRIMKKGHGRSKALKSLPEESLLRRKFEMIFKP